MLNIFSYIGVSLQSELCLWTLLGLIRTIFDATLFKVNANLKQVWQMSMPDQLSMPVQRVMRTIISGVMLVQCFTVYVYLATYIVLLYPVFLEERPTLVLPWLLLAAIRKFLCELTSLALGLGACVLLGAARPTCIRFVVIKIASITPAFYMWMLVFSYYNTLKVAASFKRFAVAPTMKTSDHDYGLELAVRRRRTKSLQGEDHLRKKLVASLNYGETESSASRSITPLPILKSLRMVHSTHADFQDLQADLKDPFYSLTPLANEPINFDQGAYEDWFGSEIIVPRDADRILEQFSLMMLRIAVCLKEDGTDPAKLFSSHSCDRETSNNMDCSTPLHGTIGDTSPLVSTQGKTASYVQNYPQIFMKKAFDAVQIQNETILNSSQRPNIENIDETQQQSQEQILPVEESNAKNNKKLGVNYEESTISSEFVAKSNPTAEDSKNTPKVIETQSTTSNTIKDIKYDDIEIQKAESQTIPFLATNKIANPKTKIKLDGNPESDTIRNPKSDSQVTKESDSVEKEIKMASEDTYDSRTASGHTMNTSNSFNSLDTILRRMKKNLPEKHQNETDNPTSTRAIYYSQSQDDKTSQK